MWLNWEMQTVRNAADIVQNFKIGAVGELYVALDLLARGWEVYRNLAAVGPDLMAHRSGVTLRIEATVAASAKWTKLNKYPGVTVAIVDADGVTYWVLDNGKVVEVNL